MDNVYSDEEVLFAVQRVVESSNVRVQVNRRRCVEAEPAGIQSISDRGVVRWILRGGSCQCVERCLVDSGCLKGLLILGQIQRGDFGRSAVWICAVAIVDRALAEAG